MLTQLPSYLKNGQEYMRIWPMQKQLYALFPECRIITATKLAIKIMPPLAILIVAMQIQVLGKGALPQAIAMGAFFVSMPLQGMLWLGHRSEQELPPHILSWYKEIHAKMRAEGCELRRITQKPKFKELAILLRTAFKELDKAFTKHLF
ncbi:terminus macrodomain insulation protein YfbV [Glaciecola petra]|uniref:UPF0208 membrane protein YfbV n=1 Tax=Glaciecola petra TaxID=3075602 RepID=A0ABU2ZNP5_9ALTE|nr:terminus macrodomain insulation protein YfbV [Aestuariibacter sp. P117]MDT0594020.1 terminus macrodomain insulation protein YfbV [Aestuariibacter sp. P117]